MKTIQIKRAGILTLCSIFLLQTILFEVPGFASSALLLPEEQATTPTVSLADLEPETGVDAGSLAAATSGAFLADDNPLSAAAASPSQSGDVFPSGELTEDDMTPLPAGATFTRVAPSGNTTAALEITGGFTMEYDTTMGGWAGAGYTFDDYGTWPERESADLSGYQQLVFGLSGATDRIKLEVIDVNYNRAVVYLNGFQSGQEQFWAVDRSRLTGIDLSQVANVFFIAEGANEQGTLTMRHRAAQSRILPPSMVSPYEIKELPVHNMVDGYTPAAVTVAPNPDAASVEETDRGMIFTYDIGWEGWSGTGFSYAATGGGRNFSSLEELTFGLKGDMSEVKLELVNRQGEKSTVKMTGISQTEQVWRIPMALFSDIDLTSIDYMYFIAEGFETQGQLEINRRPLPQEIHADAGLESADILAINVENPEIELGGGSAAISQRGVEFNYVPDSDGNASIVVENDFLLGLADEGWVLGLQGDAPDVEIELIDTSLNKYNFLLKDILDQEEKIFRLPMVNLRQDEPYFRLASVYRVRFIVRNATGAGQLNLNLRPALEDIEALPEPVFPATVAPDGAIAETSATNRGVRFDFDTRTAGWAITGFRFDDPDTPGGETGDLRDRDKLTFGLQGDVSSVRWEIVATGGAKVSGRFNGIDANQEKAFTIDISDLPGSINLNHIWNIYFVVEDALEGQLVVNHMPPAPIVPPGYILPSLDKTEDDLTELPATTVNGLSMPTISPLRPSSASSQMTASERGFEMNYGTGFAGWVGGGLSYDHFGTGPLETADLSAFDEFVFSLQGNPGEVKVEFIDDQGGRASIKLLGVVPGEANIFTIPGGLLDGVNLSRLRMVYFIVEGFQRVGNLKVNHVPTNVEEPNWLPFVTYLGEKQTSRGLVKMYYYDQRSNDTIYFWNPSTGEHVSHNLQGTLGFSQWKATSPDGNYAIVGNYINRVYVAPVRPGFPPRQYALLPLLPGETTDEIGIESAVFISDTEVEILQETGRRYLLDITTMELTLIPDLNGWTVAPSNSDFALRVVSLTSAGAVQETLEIKDLTTGEIQVLKSVQSQTGGMFSAVYDVSPDTMPGGPVAVYHMRTTDNINLNFYRTVIARVDNPADPIREVSARHAQPDFPIQSLSFEGDQVKIVSHHVFSDDTITEDIFTISIFVDRTVRERDTHRIHRAGTLLHFDADTPYILQPVILPNSILDNPDPQTDWFLSQVAVYDRSNGDDQLWYVRVLGTGSGESIEFPFLDAYTTTTGRRVVGISSITSFQGHRTVLEEQTDHRVLYLDGVVEAVDYRGSTAIYSILKADSSREDVIVNLETMEILDELPLPDGWILAESNSNFAFKEDFELIEVGGPSPHTIRRNILLLQDLRTGVIQEVYREHNGSSLRPKRDVDPAGEFVIFEFSATGTNRREHYTEIQSIADSNTYERIVEEFPASFVELTDISFSGGQAVLKVLSTHHMDTEIEKTFTVTLSSLSVSDPVIRLAAYGAAFAEGEGLYVQEDYTPVVFGDFITIYDRSQGLNNMTELLRVGMGSISQGVYVFDDIYRAPSGDRVVSVTLAVDQFSYDRSVMVNVETGDVLRLNDAITAVTYNGNRAVVDLAPREGAAYYVTVDLETMEIIENRPTPFEFLDTNGNGEIEVVEVIPIFRTLLAMLNGAPHDLAYDVNGDGFLTPIDLLILINTVGSDMSENEKRRADVFDAIDDNNDYALTPGQQIKWNAFLALDRVADGVIDAEDTIAVFGDMVAALNGGAAPAGFDIDGDQAVTALDYLHLIEISELYLDEVQKRKLDLFQLIDRDGNYELNTAEAHQWNAVQILDSDEDWVISYAEATQAIYAAIALLNVSNTAYDVNGDGRITIYDIMILIQVRNLIL